MDYESLILESISREQLEERVAEKVMQFHGLLTREVALKLIAKEKGLIRDQEKKRLGEIEKGQRRLAVEAKVKRIWPVAKYKSGKSSRVIELEDETGSMPLVLWNDDVDLATRLKTRDTVLVKGAYERNDELHLGHSGTIQLLGKAPFSDLSSLAPGEYAHVKGFVSRIDGFDRFVDEKSAGFGFSFFVSDGKKDVQVIIWGKPGRGNTLQVGDEVILENTLEKNGRLELSEDARILARRKERMLLGELVKIEGDEERMKVKVGEKEVEFDRENSLRFLGIELAGDIMLSTAISLKKRYLLNCNVAVRIRESGGKTIVEK